MDYWVFYIIFLFILLPLVLGGTIPIFKAHRESTGKTVNHDAFMRKFVYKINREPDDIISILRDCNEFDDLTFEFESDRSVVLISEYGSHLKYMIRFRKIADYWILSLEQTELIGGSRIPYKLNPFMIQKLQAEIVPFDEFGF